MLQYVCSNCFHKCEEVKETLCLECHAEFQHVSSHGRTHDTDAFHPNPL